MNKPLLSPLRPASRQSGIRIMLVVADGVSLTTLSSTLEPFQQANTCLNRKAFDIQLVGLGHHSPTTQAGIPVPCQAMAGDVLVTDDISDRPDLVILCCGQTLLASLHKPLQRFIRKLMRVRIPYFALGAACEAIAVTGAITNRKCAAHWKTLASLGERYPHVEFDSVLFASDGRFTSCAGELATFDLITDFIERVCGPRISSEVCNHFLACGKRSGESHQYLNADAILCEDTRFQQVLALMFENIETPVSTAELARRIGLSTRQLERIFAKNGFQSPLKYYVRLRLNRARQLLEQTRMPLTEIALACGFETQSNFSKTYKRVFGEPPNASRAVKPRDQIVLSSGSCT